MKRFVQQATQRLRGSQEQKGGQEAHGGGDRFAFLHDGLLVSEGNRIPRLVLNVSPSPHRFPLIDHPVLLQDMVPGKKSGRQAGVVRNDAEQRTDGMIGKGNGTAACYKAVFLGEALHEETAGAGDRAEAGFGSNVVPSGATVIAGAGSRGGEEQP